MTENEFKKVIGEITVMCRGVFDNLKIARYWEKLEKEDFNKVWINLQKHIESERFEPFISDLIKPSMSFHDHLKRDTQIFLNSPIVKDSKGEPPPAYVKDYMNKLRAELQNKRENGE